MKKKQSTKATRRCKLSAIRSNVILQCRVGDMMNLSSPFPHVLCQSNSFVNSKSTPANATGTYWRYTNKIIIIIIIIMTCIHLHCDWPSLRSVNSQPTIMPYSKCSSIAVIVTVRLFDNIIHEQCA